MLVSCIPSHACRKRPAAQQSDIVSALDRVQTHGGLPLARRTLHSATLTCLTKRVCYGIVNVILILLDMFFFYFPHLISSLLFFPCIVCVCWQHRRSAAQHKNEVSYIRFICILVWIPASLSSWSAYFHCSRSSWRNSRHNTDEHMHIWSGSIFFFLFCIKCGCPFRPQQQLQMGCTAIC